MAEGALRGHPVTGPAPEAASSAARAAPRVPARRARDGARRVRAHRTASLLAALRDHRLRSRAQLLQPGDAARRPGSARRGRQPQSGRHRDLERTHSIQNQLATQYTAQPELKNGIVVCITQVPASLGDPVTVKVSYQFHFLPLVGAAAKALGGLTLSSTQTERAEVVPTEATRSVGNQNGRQCARDARILAPASLRCARRARRGDGPRGGDAAGPLPLRGVRDRRRALVRLQPQPAEPRGRCGAGGRRRSTAAPASATPSPAPDDAIGQVAQKYAGAADARATSPVPVPTRRAHVQEPPEPQEGDARPTTTSSSTRRRTTGTTVRRAGRRASPMGTAPHSTVCCGSPDEDGNAGRSSTSRSRRTACRCSSRSSDSRRRSPRTRESSLAGQSRENNIGSDRGPRRRGTPRASASSCVNATTNAVIKTITLSKDATGDPNFPTRRSCGTTRPATRSPAVPAVSRTSTSSRSSTTAAAPAHDATTTASNSGLRLDQRLRARPTPTQRPGCPPQLTHRRRVSSTGCSRNTVLRAVQPVLSRPRRARRALHGERGVSRRTSRPAPGQSPVRTARRNAVDASRRDAYTHAATTRGTRHAHDRTRAARRSLRGDGPAPVRHLGEPEGRIGPSDSNCGNGHGCTTTSASSSRPSAPATAATHPDDSGPIVALRSAARRTRPPTSSARQNTLRRRRSVDRTSWSRSTVQGLHFDRPRPGGDGPPLRNTTTRRPASSTAARGTERSERDAITNGCPSTASRPAATSTSARR